MRIFKPPALLQTLFPQIIWKGMRDGHQVYLSFDDGPDPLHTPAILNILNHEQVRATFFVLGHQAAQYAELLKRIHREGHQIGIHGFRHQRLFYQSSNELCRQLEACKTTVEALIGKPIQFFRPPFGTFSPRLLKICDRLRLNLVLWSLMTYDFDIKLPDQFIIDLVSQKATAGDILVLHDGHRHSNRTVRILQPMIHLLKNKGLKLALIEE